MRSLFGASVQEELPAGLETPLTLLDFCSAVVDMLTNVHAARADPFVQEVLEAFVRNTRIIEAMDVRSPATRPAISFALSHAHTIFLFVNPWRVSVFHGADWVEFYASTWMHATPTNGPMHDIVTMLQELCGGDARSRANLMAHLANVCEQSALLFVRREKPTKRGAGGSKGRGGKSRTAAAHTAAHTAARTASAFSAAASSTPTSTAAPVPHIPQAALEQMMSAIPADQRSDMQRALSASQDSIASLQQTPGMDDFMLNTAMQMIRMQHPGEEIDVDLLRGMLSAARSAGPAMFGGMQSIVGAPAAR